MNTLTTTAVTSIDLYQRWLSPLKGFRCAHAALYGGASCSAAIRDILVQQGVAGSGAAIAARLHTCRQAASHLAAAPLVTGGRVRGVCCCGPVPIPFRCG
ncbi:putative component of membrane protein insertase Oxa1/YidC/SpoIIIJ protein YidD [Deinococcus metalli]|uniref:Putative component of membrane protein insertase Oxa1/YidC/SpoIIIJ protein YidD n=1 Tax=Deinococcus metalli TaxID=1141878 RepID=A0A7W8NNI7_9DEIO|nr:membrane protein insertion efficiency factor YidD [Deinococcus metalli]MBB5375801.1 putative component of membrane protein insertase Oxa1/YidC/SpoIIIJ protein YidD [Deinococcus metalli]GHF36951.1 hypothetical protein GCM10017781_12030 [Deinococcus metalli]